MIRSGDRTNASRIRNVLDFDFDRRRAGVAPRGKGFLERLRNAAGAFHMGVLDQHHIVEPVPMIHTAA